MAIKVNITFQEKVYPEAYIKINKIVTSNSDVEFYENQPDDTQILKWLKSPTHTANVLVYSDQEARSRNVIPIDQRRFDFDYDLVGTGFGMNIYAAAYNQFKESLKVNNILDFEDV